MSYDVNILVNGSRCKQYNHNGKIFIEAKEGSEYTIEIKNNNWVRCLAVCSVDGLDILTGKTAVEEGPGYVINGYNSSKFDGFRVSDNKVAKFVFDTKKASYAASKEDGSEANVGVIGVRIFNEKVVLNPSTFYIRNSDWNPWDNSGTPFKPTYNPPPIWCDVTYGSCADSMSDASDKCNYDATIKPRSSANMTKGRSDNSNITAMFCSATPSPEPNPRGFDMGTKWGEAKESKVVEVEFERGLLALTTNIYYASRQSLLEMGVPLGNEKQVSFPEPFADSKYAKPPKNWKG